MVEKKNTKEKYAVKAFSKDYLVSQKKGKESLINEINIMKDLNHENLMHLYEVHESQNSVYLVLELLEGGELLDQITKNKGRMKIAEYKHIIKSILQGLKYLDSVDIMHRDLKPENIILQLKQGGPETPTILQNTLKLVDFGLGTHCNIPEYLFKRCGTPGFVAPEVVNASSEENIKYSTKCDVFSAGVIFYLM
jgi:serine/threonine protein kinase